MTKDGYDYVIVGAGASGLQLALAFVADSYFKDKHILLIDKNTKTKNDKTWSFWESGAGQWDSIIYKSWQKANFYAKESDQITLDLIPFIYKSLRSEDFYAYAKTILSNHAQVDWIQGDVKEIKTGYDRQIHVVLQEQTFICQHCFDSRLTAEVLSIVTQRYIVLYQHFKGWVIEFDTDVFDEETFVMMDFRLQHQDSTSFTYVLPKSSRQALVEFTLFTKEVFNESSQYDHYLKNYIKSYISDKPYRIKEVEQGVIPMTNYPFHEPKRQGITKIGTIGSWVRPSSGYAFKYIEKYVKAVLNNMKENRAPDHKLLNPKTRLLDSILLDVLDKENHLGPAIFHTMYAKNSIQQIFSFLDGETSLAEDVKIIGSFEKRPFLKAAFRQMISYKDDRP